MLYRTTIQHVSGRRMEAKLVAQDAVWLGGSSRARRAMCSIVQWLRGLAAAGLNQPPGRGSPSCEGLYLVAESAGCGIALRRLAVSRPRDGSDRDRVRSRVKEGDRI
jgi:hypothetical protein